MIYNKELASALTPLISHHEAMDGLTFFVEHQIERINEQLHHATSWDAVRELQGRYNILKEFLTIKYDAVQTLKGNT